METMTMRIDGMSCGHCVKAVRDALDEVPGVQVQRVDVGTANGNAQARSRGVLGVPTYVFLDPVGQEVARLIGEQPLERVLSSVAAAAGRPCGT